MCSVYMRVRKKNTLLDYDCIRFICMYVVI